MGARSEQPLRKIAFFILNLLFFEFCYILRDVEENMRIYLDNCCFNRPFDDQSQIKIKLEGGKEDDD